MTATQLERAAEANVDASRVCIHCWHQERQIFLEDETHALFLCPRYARERADWFAELSDTTANMLHSTHGVCLKLGKVLQSQVPADWAVFGKFVTAYGSLVVACGLISSEAPTDCRGAA